MTSLAAAKPWWMLMPHHGKRSPGSVTTAEQPEVSPKKHRGTVILMVEDAPMNSFWDLEPSGEVSSGLSAPSGYREPGCLEERLERAFCKFREVDYPPIFDRIGKEEFDRAIGRQMLLTDKQLRAASLAALGFQDKEIATQMGISTCCVKTHLQAIARKANIHGRTQIALWYTGQPFPKV